MALHNHTNPFIILQPTTKPTKAPTPPFTLDFNAASMNTIGASSVDGGGGTGAICFTGSSLLTLEDGTTKEFRDLQVREDESEVG